MVAHDGNVSTEGPGHEYFCELEIFWYSEFWASLGYLVESIIQRRRASVHISHKSDFQSTTIIVSKLEEREDEGCVSGFVEHNATSLLPVLWSANKI